MGQSTQHTLLSPEGRNYPLVAFSVLAWSFGAFSIDIILVYTVAYARLKI